MPLELLVILVVGGITGIAALTWAFGFSKPFEFQTDNDAKMAWLRAHPGDDIHSVRISSDRRAALIGSAKGIGLVWSFGADTTARLLDDISIQDAPDGLDFRLEEYTAPRLKVRLAPEDRDIWRQQLGQPT